VCLWPDINTCEALLRRPDITAERTYVVAVECLDVKRTLYLRSDPGAAARFVESPRHAAHFHTQAAAKAAGAILAEPAVRSYLTALRRYIRECEAHAATLLDVERALRAF
jgi:hypothetical protein